LAQLLIGSLVGRVGWEILVADTAEPFHRMTILIFCETFKNLNHLKSGN